MRTKQDKTKEGENTVNMFVVHYWEWYEDRELNACETNITDKGKLYEFILLVDSILMSNFIS